HGAGRLPEPRVLALAGGELPPVPDLHPGIEEDQADPRRVRAGLLQRLLPVRGFHPSVAFAFEDGRERAPHVGVVLHDQDALRLPLHLSLIWPVGSTRLGTEARSSTDVRGSRTPTVAPCPSPSLLP